MESGRQSRQKTESQRIRLAEAITNGRLYQTKMILTDFTNLNYLDDEGLSPLMRAFMIEDVKHRTRSAMVRLLIHHNADVNLRDKYGQTVLNWACKMNKFDLVKLLLEKCLQDVDLTSQDLQGNTPLIYAVINNNVNMVKLLVDTLKKFALSVDHRNKQDKTAYLKALEMGFNECATILSQVGKASQDIKANPFLDFLPIPNKETSKKVRVRSAPLAKDYGSIRREINDSKKFMINRKNARVNDSLFDRNRTYFARNKKQGNRLFKSRKVHSVVSQKTQNENSRTNSHTPIANKAQNTKSMKNGKKAGTYVGDNTSCSILHSRLNKNEQKKSLRTSMEETNSVVIKKDPLLRILLDESQSQTSSSLHSPRSCDSYTSCNQINKKQSVMVLPTVNGLFPCKKAFHENDETWRKDFPDYHSYLVWKASLNYPSNSLPSFLALRAEQHSESSSYRKGLVIPRYEPGSEASVYDRSGGATSPASERSAGRSEAGRKISAVVKTVGLSIYLTNKRKSSYKKDN